MIGSSCISSTIFYYTPSPKSASYYEAFVLKYITKLYYTVYCFDKLLNKLINIFYNEDSKAIYLYIVYCDSKTGAKFNYLLAYFHILRLTSSEINLDKRKKYLLLLNIQFKYSRYVNVQVFLTYSC